MYTKKNYGTNSAATTTAPAPAAKGGGGKPSHSLSYGVPKGEGQGFDFTDVTGLFDAEDKNGKGYLKVTVKQAITIPAGATLFIRPKTERNS